MSDALRAVPVRDARDSKLHLQTNVDQRQKQESASTDGRLDVRRFITVRGIRSLRVRVEEIEVFAFYVSVCVYVDQLYIPVRITPLIVGEVVKT